MCDHNQQLTITVEDKMQAKGTFEVNIQPMESYAQGKEGVTLGRMSIDKTFLGELSATSQGEMLTVMTDVEGSAGYVAIEQVSGTLLGRTGSFVVQHFGIMSQGENRLVLEVAPDSGTGDLAGISGAMTIRIEGGTHFYEFNFGLDPQTE